MLVILAMGAAFGGWAALAVMGAERARRLSQIEARRPTVITATLSPPPSNPSHAKTASPRKRDGAPTSAGKNAR